MLSGPELIKRLQDELQAIRHAASNAEAKRTEYDANIYDLVKKRGVALLALAKHYLPELSQESIRDTFANIQTELTALLERQQRAIDTIGEREERLNRQYQEALDKQKSAQTVFDKITADLAELEQKVADFLKHDFDFQTITNTTLQAEQRLTQNELRLKEIKEDATSKLPAYQQSSLFQYLLKQKFGTPDYDHRGLIRTLDRWLARKINFATLEQSYNFLTHTPKLMQTEFESRQKEFTHLMQQVEEAEQQAEKTLGLTELQAHHETEAAKLTQLSSATEAVYKILSEVQIELEELKSSQGDFYQSALDRFRTFLEQTETSVLTERAEKTIEKVDDDLVSEIDWINGEIDSLERDHTKVNESKTVLQSQIKDMEFVIRRCEQTEVSTERCTFSQAFNWDRSLEQFKKNAINGQGLWDLIKKEQIVAPRWSEQTQEMVTAAMKSPQSRILFQAMTHVAVIALRSAVERGLSRRDAKK